MYKCRVGLQLLHYLLHLGNHVLDKKIVAWLEVDIFST